MGNLLRISGRRFRVAIRSHLAAVIIATAVLVAWLLFWGYTEAMGQSISSRVESPSFPADVILSSQNGINLSTAYAAKVCSYKQQTVGTPYGQLSLGAMTSVGYNGPLPAPKDGEVWIPLDLQQRWQIPLGADFTLRIRQGYGYSTIHAQVAGTYAAFAYDPAIFVNNRWLINQGVTIAGPELSLFNPNPSNIQQFSKWLSGVGPSVKVLNAASIISAARQIANGTFSSGGQAVGLLFLFMALGVGTFSLLSYMDSRRELAILKSMGLRPHEVGLLFIMEGALTATLGYLLALCISWLVARYSSLPVTVTTPIMLRVLLYALVAFVMATAIPYTLARSASVNELMLNRPVPLFRSKVTQLTRHYPMLETRLAAGLQCVKLPVPDGEFPGICFRQTGQRVKRGETIAWESYAWGMGERNYFAPCSGEVVECDLSQGLLVIRPD